MSDVDILRAAYRAALERGDVERAKRYAEGIAKATGEADAGQHLDKPTGLERVGRGVADITQGVSGLARNAVGGESASQYNRAKTEEAALYERARGPDAGIDWLRMAGATAALAPLALVPGGQSLGAKAGIGALQGAAGGAVSFTPGDEDYWSNKAAQMGLSGLLGGVLAPAAAAAGGAAKTGLNRLRPSGQFSAEATVIVDDAMSRLAGQLPQNVMGGVRDSMLAQVDDLLRAGKTVSPEQLARKARLEALGFEPTTAQVTRHPSDWTSERELSKLDGVGGGLLERFRAQNQQLNQKADEFAGLLGPLRSPYETGRLAIDTAEEISRHSQKVVSDAYDAAAKTPGIGQRLADEGPLKSRLTEIYDTFSDVIPGAVDKRLRAIVDGDKAPTVENLNEALKLVNARFGSSQGPEKAALGELRSALITTMDGMGGDGNAAAAQLRVASDLAKKRFGLIDGRTHQKTRMIEDLIADRANADKFVQNKVLGGKTDELLALRDFLTNPPKEFKIDPAQGAEAWQAIRRSVIDQINKKAGVGDPDVTQVSGVMWKKALESLGDRRSVLFTADENAALDGLIQAAIDLTRAPPLNAVNNSNTASQAANLIARAVKAPVIGDLAAAIRLMAKPGMDQRRVNVALRGLLAPEPIPGAMPSGTMGPLLAPYAVNGLLNE